MIRAWVLAFTVVAAWVMATALPAPAQPPVRLVGEVQWVAAVTMAGRGAWMQAP
ncbi:MAG TPA: hypothetical protein VFJ24_06285 [Gaiellales bacterium]|nr:hypothetical protein [Gaiellales bacterium]